MHVRTILTIDDNEGDQVLSRMRIERVDPTIKIHSAFDGEEALELLRSGACKPDLIFLDIHMPGMDGFDFLDAYAKAFQPPEHRIVIMLTSPVQEADRERARRHPAVVGHLTKPLGHEWKETLGSILSS